MDEQPQQPTQESIENAPVEPQVPLPPSPEIQTPEPQEQPVPEPSIPAETSTQEPSTTIELLQPQEPQPPESIPQETALPTTAEQPAPAEPAKQEIQERPASPERPPSHRLREAGERGEVVEKTVEKEIVRELNEEEQQALYKSRLKTLSTKGNQSRSARRAANHTKIIEYLKQHGYITNNEVEKLCKVKNPTAWKYLKELEEQSLIIQLGERGKRVRYRLHQAI